MTTNEKEMQMDVHVSHDDNAIHEVTNLTFIDGYKIVETTGGIDCDNAGRAYSNENEISYQDMMWGVLNHISYYGTKGITSAVTGNTVDYHSPNAEWNEIRITLPSDDPESFGTVYTITVEI